MAKPKHLFEKSRFEKKTIKTLFVNFNEVRNHYKETQ